MQANFGFCDELLVRLYVSVVLRAPGKQTMTSGRGLPNRRCVPGYLGLGGLGRRRVFGLCLWSFGTLSLGLWVFCLVVFGSLGLWSLVFGLEIPKPRLKQTTSTAFISIFKMCFVFFHLL